MRILKKIIVGLLIFFVVLGIAGFFIAPPLVKPFIMKKMSEALHRKVSIEKISINPYVLSITLRGFSLEGIRGTQHLIVRKKRRTSYPN